jgi:anti-sigma B factor antagonist
MPGDGADPAQDLVAIFTVVDVTARLIDGHVHDAVRDPRRTVCRHGQPDAMRTDEVTHGLRVISDRVGNTVVVRAIGEVDLRNVDGLAAALRAGWLAACPPGRLVVDLSGVVFFSVAGLALLVATEQQCRERELELRVVATIRSVLRALQVTGLNVLFDMIPTLVAATRPRMSPEWTIRTRP